MSCGVYVHTPKINYKTMYLIYTCAYVGLSLGHVPVGAALEVKGIQSPGARAAGGYERPNVGTGN